MFKIVKKIIKWVCPLSIQKFLIEIQTLHQSINNQIAQLLRRVDGQSDKILMGNQRQVQSILDSIHLLQTQLGQNQDAAFRSMFEQMQTQLEQNQDAVFQRIFEQMQAQNSIMLDIVEKQKTVFFSECQCLRDELNILNDNQNKISTQLSKIGGQSTEIQRTANEAVWASIFSSTISGSTWLKDTSFSPGRWAVGYPVLYVLYRILNEIRPRHILELGLGQSTRMISQYVADADTVEHFVVEHNPQWISFFERNYSLSEKSRIIKLDWEMIPYQDAETVRTYKGFADTFCAKQFDLIFIDAPLGGDMKEYSRIDILSILPECLAENFIVIMDDCNRAGEVHTWEEIRKKMKACGISYAEGAYSGDKDMRIMVSESLHFLTTL